MKPRLLDLFCKAGGCTKGYQRAGFYVVGVDIEPQPRYCGDEFHQADAMTYPLDGFDAIHASPPCQRYSVASRSRRNNGHEYPDLLAPCRSRLEASGVPWVIENVPGAPMRADAVLCGCMFGLKNLRRKRWFECSWYPLIMHPNCRHDPSELVLSVVGHGTPSWTRKAWQVGGGAGCPKIADYRRAMGIDWMNRGELSQAIPPCYTEFIGGYLLQALPSFVNEGFQNNNAPS